MLIELNFFFALIPFILMIECLTITCYCYKQYCKRNKEEDKDYEDTQIIDEEEDEKNNKDEEKDEDEDEGLPSYNEVCN